MKTSKGFSIIELMISVAILGILAALGTVNYRTYIKKARTNEARAVLSNYYRAYHMMLIEYGCASGNFPNIGFKPVGEMAYRIQAGDEGTNCNVPDGYWDEPGCISTDKEGCGGSPPDCCVQVGSRTVYDRGWEETETAISCGPDARIPAATKTPPIDTDPHTFAVFACARFQYEQNDDIWLIDESKEIRSGPF